MIALMLVAQLSAQPLRLDQQQIEAREAQALRSLQSVELLSETPAPRLLLAYPPCGTPEAEKAEACILWTADPKNPRAIGYVPPLVNLRP